MPGKIGSAQELKISVTGVNDIAPEGASVEQTTKTDLVAEDIKQNLETEPLHANISVEETETEAASSDTQEDIVVVFIVGGPGSGKGTQCDKLVRKFGFVHLSSGELLREEVSINSAIGKNVKELMEKGHLVPLDTVLKLLKNAVLTKFSTNRLFLIDGYPREVEQGIKFESEVAKCSFVIYFEVADETMISRLKNRLELSGRTDDNEQTVTERIHTFHIVTKPVIEYYKQKGILTTINANRSEEEIFSDVVKLFSTFPLISGSLLTDIKVIFVVGGPGSGKGTQCARMVDQYGFCHLSSGDLLREEVATQSTRGKELNAIMERGELVPLDIVLQLIREAMITNSSKSNCFLIDGYPRKLEQGIKFEKEIGPCRGVLYFEVPDSVMVERLLERAKTSGRIDDNEETIKKRLETFHNETKPVISYYNNLKKVVKVNADGSQDNVFAQVKTYLDSHSW